MKDDIEKENWGLSFKIFSCDDQELSFDLIKDQTIVGRGEHCDFVLNNEKYFKNLIKVSNISCFEKGDKPDRSSTVVINDVEIFIPLANLINLDKEIIRLKDKIADYEGRMKSVRKKIDNENFVKRAPKEIVEHEKKKYLYYENNFNKLKENLNNLI